MKGVRAVLFDLDGTIVEFRLRAWEAKQAIIDLFRARGLEMRGVTGSSSLQEIIEVASREMGGDAHYDVAWATAMSIIERYEEEARGMARPITGMVELIKALKGMNLMVGVVTNNSHSSTRRWLRELGLSGVLDVVVTRDHVRRLKPSPDSLLLAIRWLGCEPRSVVFVGDSLFDYEAAMASGVNFVAFLGGAHSEQLWRMPQIEHKARDVQELLGIITRLREAPHLQQPGGEGGEGVTRGG